VKAADTEHRGRRAAALRRLRTERDMTLGEAAARFGLSKSELSRAERGERRPPPVADLAAAFGTTEADVLGTCPQCGYEPPPGFRCLRCGTDGTGPARPTWRADAEWRRPEGAGCEESGCDARWTPERGWAWPDGLEAYPAMHAHHAVVGYAYGR
jgi:transcriptional regulator with XRE-family HTH domain